MCWYKLGDEWWINLARVQSFGITDDNKIAVIFYDGTKQQFIVDDVDCEFQRMEKSLNEMTMS